jgi:16S rRNA (guanine527-N7)-methyltransferase
MEPENRGLLVEGAKTLGIHLDGKAVEVFDLYADELLKWNEKINLTAIRTEKGIVLKHFLDSLSAHPFLPGHSSLLDIGSGAGFPGIPLKIVEPSLQVTLVDSVLKKVDFQRHIIRRLGLQGIEAVHGRVQQKEMVQRMEGRFDRVISRAFSHLPSLLTLSYPFLRKGGRVLAMKGQVMEDEIRCLSDTDRTLYRLEKAVSFLLPFSTFKRSILMFEKQ